MTVFFTSFALGHETRRISARTSRKNWPIRPKNPNCPNLWTRRSCRSTERSRELCDISSELSSSAMTSSTFFDTQLTILTIQLAGVPGFEPGLSVLETDVLAVDTIPLRSGDAAKRRYGDAEKNRAASPRLPVSVSGLISFL